MFWFRRLSSHHKDQSTPICSLVDTHMVVWA